MRGQPGSRVAHLSLGLLLIALTAGCTAGQGDTPRWAVPPAGIGLRVDFDGDEIARLTGGPDEGDGSLRGELLSVQPDGILLWARASTGHLPWLQESNLVLLEFPALRLANVNEYNLERRRRGRRFGADDPQGWDYLRRWARYPGPLDQSRIDAIVEALGEPGVVRVALPRSGADVRAPRADEGADIDAFLSRARAATLRFQDRRVAIREGYRRLGPDFPGMGEHWVHPGRAVSGEVHAEQPPVLSYLPVEGEPRLTGVAWTVPLAPGETPPSTPLGDSVWHDHSGTLDEEAILLDSPRSHGPAHANGTHPHGAGEAAHAAADGGARLSMVHAWLWVPNPDGMLAQNNWALPFVRAGLEVPDEIAPAVARALSLAGSGADYYRTLLARASGAGAADLGIIDEHVSEAARAVDALIAAAVRDGPAGDPARLRTESRAEAVEIWTRMWGALERDLSPAAWQRLQTAAAVWGAA